nr:unnamed protein product [Callosobruchus analis]
MDSGRRKKYIHYHLCIPFEWIDQLAESALGKSTSTCDFYDFLPNENGNARGSNKIEHVNQSVHDMTISGAVHINRVGKGVSARQTSSESKRV